MFEALGAPLGARKAQAQGIASLVPQIVDHLGDEYPLATKRGCGGQRGKGCCSKFCTQKQNNGCVVFLREPQRRLVFLGFPSTPKGTRHTRKVGGGAFLGEPQDSWLPLQHLKLRVRKRGTLKKRQPKREALNKRERVVCCFPFPSEKEKLQWITMGSTNRANPY